MKSLLVLLSAVLYASAQECSQVTAKAAEGTGNGEGLWHIVNYSLGSDDSSLEKCGLYNAGAPCECITIDMIAEEEGEPIPHYTVITKGKRVEDEGLTNSSFHIYSTSDTQLLYRVEEGGEDIFTLAIVDTDNFENWMVWADCSPDGPQRLWIFTKAHIPSEDILDAALAAAEGVATSAGILLGRSDQPEEGGKSTCPVCLDGGSS